MPRPSCEPCCQPGQLARTTESFRDANLKILCEILGSIEGASAIGFSSNVAFGSVPGAFATSGAISESYRVLTIKNKTDKTIEISLDGGVSIWETLYSGEVITYDLGANGVFIDTAPFHRYQAAGGAPTSGTIHYIYTG